MSEKKKQKPTKTAAEKLLQMSKPDLFGRMEKIFKDREFPKMSLVAQAERALTEWCVNNETKVPLAQQT